MSRFPVLAVGAAALAAACATGGTTGRGDALRPERRADRPPPALAPEAFLRAPADRVAKAKALVEELRSALVRGDEARAAELVSGGDLLTSVTAQLVEMLKDRETRFRLEPLCPAGDGLYVRFVTITEIFSARGHGSMEMFAGPEGGTWKLFPAGPRDAIRAKLVRETARVRIDPAAGTVRGEAEMTLRGGGERFVPIAMDLVPMDPEEDRVGDGGFRLTGLEVGGRPGRFQVMPGSDVVVAEVATSGEMLTVRLSWEGAPGTQLNYVKKDEVLLHEAQPWLPRIGGREIAEWDLTVEHPESFEVLLEGDAAPHAIEAGWVARRSRVKSDLGSTIFGRPAYATRRSSLSGGAVKVLLAVSPTRTKEEIDALETAIRATDASLSVLGKLPAADLRIVESTPPAAAAAVGGRSFIALGTEAMKPTIVAHELGHSWFGGLIPNSFKGEWGGQWPESLAEYVVSWTVDEPRALRLREEWVACYAPFWGEEDPLAVTRNVAWSASRPVLYCKGPLILAALERRVGRAKMQAVLAAFVQARANRASTWEHVLDAVRAEAGEAHAAWLATRLKRAGAPGFDLEGLAVKNGMLEATLVQRRAFADTGAELHEDMELGFADAEGKPLGVPILLAVTLRRTPLSIPLPAGAAFVELDPLRRSVWKRGTRPGAGKYAIPRAQSR